MKRIFAPLIITLLAASACEVSESEMEGEESKNDEVQVVEGIPSNRDTVMMYLHGSSSKTWMAQSFTIASMSSFQTCRLDDQIELNQDGTYLYDGGASLCGGEDSEMSKSGSWSLDNDNQTIIFEESDGDSFNGTITGLNSTEISLSSTYVGLTVEGRYQSAN